MLACSLIFNHHSDELIEVETAIMVSIAGLNYIHALFICQIFSYLLHNQPQLLIRYQPIAVSVKHFEGLDHLFLRVCILHSSVHEVQKLAEFDRSTSVVVYLLDHLIKLCVCVDLT